MKVIHVSLLLLRQLIRKDAPALTISALIALIYTGSTSFILHVITAPDRYAFGELNPLVSAACLLLVLYLVKMATHYLHLALIGDLALAVMARLQERTITMLAKSELDYPEEYIRGTLRQLLMRQMNTFRGCLRAVLITLARDVPLVIGLHIVMFLHDWRLALLSCVVLPTSLLTLHLLGNRARQRQHKAEQDWQEAQNSVTTLRRPIRRRDKNTPDALAPLTAALAQHRHSFRRAQHARFIAIATVDWPVGVLLFGALLYLGLTLTGDLGAFASTVASPVAFLIGAVMAYRPLKRIAKSYMRIGRYGQALQQIPALGGTFEPQQRAARMSIERPDDLEDEIL